MEIRRATVQDAAAVVTCVVEAFKDYMVLIGRTPGPMLEDYYAAIEQHHVFVIPDRAGVSAVVLLKDGEDGIMWLDVLATLPACRGKGLGRALIAYSEAYMVQLGKTECRLYTHYKYERSYNLYRHLGYETYQRVQEYGFDRYYMKKSLALR